MKIILNPKYERLRDYLTHIDFHFEQEGKEIFRDRNVLRTLRVDGLTLCVKRYAPLSLRGNLAIRIYKTSKGKKAYFKPFKLRERGFESPEPVAFVCYRKGLFSSVIYLVCLQSTYRYSLDRIMDFSVKSAAKSQEGLPALRHACTTTGFSTAISRPATSSSTRWTTATTLPSSIRTVCAPDIP